MEECSICLDDLVGSIVVLKCKHKYHDICIGTWYESNIKNNTDFVCPQCNRVSDIETIINIEPESLNKKEINHCPPVEMMDIQLEDSNMNEYQATNLTPLNLIRNRNNYTTISITSMDEEITAPTRNGPGPPVRAKTMARPMTLSRAWEEIEDEEDEEDEEIEDEEDIEDIEDIELRRKKCIRCCIS